MEATAVETVLNFYKRYSGQVDRMALDEAMSRSVGVEHEQVDRQRRRLQNRAESLDRAVANLLDNLTAINRDLVDRRIVELQRERAELDAEAESLNRRAVSKSELRGIIEDTSRFLESLESTLKVSPMPQRQAAMRRCIDSIIVDRERCTATVLIRVLPLVLGGPQSDQVHAVEVSLPKRGERRLARG